jgi:GNAT superfamily N-acetyltransferase
MTITIRPATVEDAAVIAGMAIELTEEISARLGVRHFALSRERTERLLRQLLGGHQYTALIAVDGEERAGFVGLSQGWALYAEGAIGTVQELFVAPRQRERGLGTALLEAAVALAHRRGWQRLEVCTPPLPEFERSLSFYQRHGFEITGGRKMKIAVSTP